MKSYRAEWTIPLLLLLSVTGCLSDRRPLLDPATPTGFSLLVMSLSRPSELYARGALDFTVAEVQVLEASSAAYAVRLRRHPLADVTISIACSDPGIDVQPSELRFSPDNSQAVQTVTVSAPDDPWRNPDTVNLTHTTASLDAAHNGLTSVLTVRRQDDERLVFVTQSTYSGNLGSVAGADAKCNSDALRPSAQLRYRALLVEPGVRVACTSAECASSGVAEHVDWVLSPSTFYIRSPGGAVLIRTDAAGIVPFSTDFLWSPFSTLAGTAWTGLAPDWTAQSICGSGWDGIGGVGSFGDLGVVTSAGVSAGTADCSELRPLICIEDP